MSEVEKLPFRILVLGNRQIKTTLQEAMKHQEDYLLDQTHKFELLIDRYPARAAWNYGFLALRGSGYPLPKEEYKQCWIKEGSPGYRGEEMKRRNYLAALCEDTPKTRRLLSTLQDLNLPCQEMPFYFVAQDPACPNSIRMENLAEEFPKILRDVMNQCSNSWLSVYGQKPGILQSRPLLETKIC